MACFCRRLAPLLLAGTLLGVLVARSHGAIDRAAVVGRHNVRFRHTSPIDPTATSYNALTVGNGEFAFTADLTGLQSLNSTYHMPSAYPLYTMSNWGWHTPDPRNYTSVWPFNADGTLAYVYENVTVDSLDARRMGNRTVPYQFNCASHNDPGLCNYLYIFPARVNLGQLSFVLPGAARKHGPFAGCSGMGGWCNTHSAHRDPATGRYTCRDIINVTGSSSGEGGNDGTGCNESASSHGWKNAPFCVEPHGQIIMTGVTAGKPNLGYFDGSCDRIQWNNTFDMSAWCKVGSEACAASVPAGEPEGPFHFVPLEEVVSADQTLDM